MLWGPHIILAFLSSLFLLSTLYVGNMHWLGLTIDFYLGWFFIGFTGIHIVWSLYWQYRSRIIAYVGVAFVIGGGLSLSAFIKFIEWVADDSRILKLIIVFGISAFILLFIVFIDKKTKATKFFLAIVIASNMFTIGGHHYEYIHLKETLLTHYKKMDVKYRLNHTPNIYYLVPDAYVAFETMQGDMPEESRDMKNFLQDNGFSIYKDARSAYASTVYSMYSTFSMKNQLREIKSSKDIFEPHNIGQNIVFKTLIENGYDVYKDGRRFAPLTDNINKIENLNPLELLIFAARLDKVLLFAYGLFKTEEQNNTIDNPHFYRAVTNLPADNKPKFIYSHSLSAHFETPICFSDYNIDWAAVETYQKQIRCVNKDLKNTISFIKDNDPNGIIIVQADHGLSYNKDEKIIKLGKRSHISDAYSILMAVTWPEQCQYFANENFTPTNLYARLFACLSDTKPDYDAMDDNISFSMTYTEEEGGKAQIFIRDGELITPEVIEFK